MRLHVMYDQTGKIVAAVRLDEDNSKQRPPADAEDGKLSRPVPKPGFTSADLDVSAEHAHLTFTEACRQLMGFRRQATSQTAASMKGRPST